MKLIAQIIKKTREISLLCFTGIIFSTNNGYSQCNATSTQWCLLGNAGTTNANYIGTINAEPLIFKTSETEWMRITPTGNVGIETTSPQAKLEVKNGIVLFNGIVDNGAPINGPGTRMMWVPSKAAFRAGVVTGITWDYSNIGAASAAFGYNTQANGDYSSAFGYGSIAQSYNSFVIGQYNVVSGTPGSWVATEPLFVIGNGVYNDGNYGGPKTLTPINVVGIVRHNALTVLKNGNVGIGPATPINKFDVQGGVAIGNSYAGIKVAPANGAIIRGNVGIGTPTPTQKLEVNGNISVTGLNSALLFGQETVSADKWGQWGIEYDNVNGGLNFWKPFGSTNFGNNFLYIKDNGNVGIGTNLTDPSNTPYKLAVNGTIRAKEIVVETNWSDFVFESTYTLMPLTELEMFIKANNHLPEIPSANEISTNGLKVAEMQTLMMQKIEELTLYIIEQNKKLENLQTKISTIEESK